MRRAALLLALGILLAGCAGSDDEPATTAASTETTTTEPTTSGETGSRAVVYFLRDGKVGPVFRSLTDTPGVARAALEALFAGPQDGERSQGLITGVPKGTAVSTLEIADGVATAGVTAPGALSPAGRAQIVYTLTQFPTVKRVRLRVNDGAAGSAVGRADSEAQTPAILVESPLPGDSVDSPLELSGTANTFEATFRYELLRPDGGKLAEDFGTATSGSGTRGTFSETLAFEIPNRQLGTLVVYESSAADGSRVHVVKIPLLLNSASQPPSHNDSD